MFTLLIRLFAGLAVVFAIVYAYMRLYALRYWQRRNIPTVAGSFPFGNILPLIRMTTSLGELVADIYNSTSQQIIGMYAIQRPMLIVRDPALVQQILVKDFAHFTDHGIYVDEERDPLSAQLFSLGGDRWKQMRHKLSPVFTAGKIRASLDTILKCGRPLNQFMLDAAADGAPISIEDISSRYLSDVIASIAFGLDVNSVVNPDAEFRQQGRKSLEPSLMNGIRQFATFVWPQLPQLLRFKTVDQDIEDFVMGTVRKTLEYRESSGVVRKDLFQLLLQLRNEGFVRSDEDAEAWKSSSSSTGGEKKKALTVEEVAAHAWFIYQAGFESSEATMTFTLFELARNPQMQRRVQEEIDRVSAQYDGQITHESLGDMKYLEMCIDETLRKYPVFPILNRECTQDYQFPDSEWRIEKGTAIMISLLGLQRDERFYDSPLEYRPERFAAGSADGSKIDRPYNPFGDGPRICIGMRLAKMQSKIGLIQMLKDTTLQLAGKHELRNGELEFCSETFALNAKGGIHLRAVRR